jgi:hypothetical protein
MEDGLTFPTRGASQVIGRLPGRLDQQAPGFCAQKSSNCSASESAGGGVSFVGLSASASGAVVPPLVSGVVAPVSPVSSGAAVSSVEVSSVEF